MRSLLDENDRGDLILTLPITSSGKREILNRMNRMKINTWYEIPENRKHVGVNLHFYHGNYFAFDGTIYFCDDNSLNLCGISDIKDLFFQSLYKRQNHLCFKGSLCLRNRGSKMMAWVTNMTRKKPFELLSS